MSSLLHTRFANEAVLRYVVTRIVAPFLCAAMAACGGGTEGGAAVSNEPSLPPGAIDKLPAGKWLQLPNTKIRSVAPPASKLVENVVNAWSGGTVDTNRSRLLVWGGGHNDYLGNEVYALDLTAVSIQRVVEQSPLAGQSACQSALPDGSPTARHTYDGLAYIAHADRFFAVGGGLSPCGDGDPATWTYDFGAREWTMKIAETAFGALHGVMAEYDSETKWVFVHDTTALYAYNPEANAYTQLATELNVDNHLTGAIDTKRRKFVMIGYDGVKVLDLSTFKMATMATTGTPSLVNENSPGVGYDPVADRIVAWSGGSDVFALNMDTGVWSQVATNAGPSALAPVQGTFGRWGYIPQYRLFALINGVDQNAWVFRLAK
jgi:hypothetical protein